MNHRTLSVQDEGADCQYGDGPRGAEVAYQIRTRQCLFEYFLKDSCLLPLSVWPSGCLSDLPSLLNWTETSTRSTTTSTTSIMTFCVDIILFTNSPNLLYRHCFFYFANVLCHLGSYFPNKTVSVIANSAPYCLFVWPRSRYVNFVQLIAEALRFSYLTQCPLCNTVCSSITCVILRHGFNINLIFQK